MWQRNEFIFITQQQRPTKKNRRKKRDCFRKQLFCVCFFRLHSTENDTKNTLSQLWNGRMHQSDNPTKNEYTYIHAPTKLFRKSLGFKWNQTWCERWTNSHDNNNKIGAMRKSNNNNKIPNKCIDMEISYKMYGEMNQHCCVNESFYGALHKIQYLY